MMKDKMVYKGDNVIGALMNVPIFVGTFSVVTDFAVLEDMDAYRDEGMGDVIVGEPFLREVRIKARQFEGMITIYNGNDEVTYQMVQSHLRFKHHTNKQCNKIPPLLMVSEEDKMNGISHPYQRLKGFYKGVLNLRPDYIRDAKMEEWLTRGHISLHEMECKRHAFWSLNEDILKIIVLTTNTPYPSRKIRRLCLHSPETTKETSSIRPRKNELNEKSTLLLAFPDEHLLKFHGIKDAKSLWEAIKTRFGGNKESKKMQKTILKQQYENFTTSRSEGLDKIYDMFQKLISQLEIQGEVISQEDANLKLLRSLPPAWNNIALIMKNKPELDELSMDDLCNNLKVYEAKIKSQSSSNSNSQNVAFVSSKNTSSTNEAVNTALDVSTANTQGQAFLNLCR
ncbi:hypothetical protein Tco_0952503 [Tanacetum coccineum]|uniref:Uncharacterized protein n=1 Tax=Tanacetum coccineum TaxID=301880 RepID=A0ABQ5DZ14_9ASTR